MELTCKDHSDRTASHVWGRQDSSDKAPPIDRERGDEGKSGSKTTYQETSGLQRLMKEKGISIGDAIMQLVDKTNNEEIDVRQSITSMLWSIVDSYKLQDACIQPKVDLGIIQMEVEGENNKPTGRFRKLRPNETMKPQGTWPKHWVDPVHESEGHDIDGLAECRIGEGHLYNGMMSLYADNGIEYAVDDISGSLLDPAAVHEGRTTEMGFFEKLKVYDRVPREEQKRTGGKVIGTKWIDVNKGDVDHPNIRCRLVGKEFKTTHDDALFASTPPLEALRCILSRAATVDEKGQCREIMINDVSRAYFYAEATRCMYIEIPQEDPLYDPNMLGRLRLCLYGTRDAALNWQQVLSDHLTEAGFKRGIGHPAVFHHPGKDIWTLVHGDDYCSAGSESSLDWMHQLLTKKYEIQTQRIGEGKLKTGEMKSSEGQVLNRVVRKTANGWELEADLRHAELIVKHLGLEDGNSVSTPGLAAGPKPDDDDDDDDDDEL